MTSSRPVDLRQAAAIIFALVAVVPLLVFAFFLSGADLLSRSDVQLGLLLALALALLGYAVFRRMVARISHLSHALSAPAEATAQPSPQVTVVPGLGAVSELGEMAQAFGRLLEELRGSTERLEDLVFKLGTLDEMVEMAAKIPRIQDLLADVLDRTMRAVRSRAGSIMLLDPERQTLRVVVSRGLPDAAGGREIAVGEGIAGRAVQQGEPVLVEDLAGDPRLANAADGRPVDGSFIAVPLRVGDRTIGVVNLTGKESFGGTPAAFSRTDLQFLNTLMTYTAYAVDNARLLEEAQEAARRLNEVVEDQKARLTLAQQQMLQAAKLSALGELVAGVAHELNNPLTVLSGMADLVAEEIPPARPRIQVMQQAITKAARIVQGLLTFARRRPLERRRVDLPALIARTLEMTAADLRLARVTVDTDVAADLPPVWADPHQLEQVLVNLVTNARQAMAECRGPRVIRLRARPMGAGGVSVVVEDTGPGIAAALLPRIFDPFVTSKGAHGTGLGLSISYGIVREHGGDIRAESQPGRGARFSIELPCGTPVDETPAVERPARPLAGRRILVVEADAQVKEILQKQLEREGCQTVVAATAEEALARLGDSIHLVVADFYLPGVNGLAFYQDVVARAPALAHRFLFLSGSPLPPAAQDLVGNGGPRLLGKPFFRQDLLQAITEALA
jgi:signal transduction histidine kinase/CheY-like chemotaxis protein